MQKSLQFIEYFNWKASFLSIYLICRFLFMIAHTREFPVMDAMMNMDCKVVMATSADMDITEGCQSQSL